jgi:hypothetical protein
MDVLPRLKLLNALTALMLPLFPLVMLFTAKGICMNRACSGLEPELLVHFRTEPARLVTLIMTAEKFDYSPWVPLN